MELLNGNGNGLKNGRIGLVRILAIATTIVSIVLLLGTATGFYIRDRVAEEDKFRDVYVRMGDNAAKIMDNARSVQDLSRELHIAVAGILAWQDTESRYDKEIRDRLQKIDDNTNSGVRRIDDRINAVANRLHERLDQMQILLVQKAIGNVPNYTDPRPAP
jgi:hypothetical protein